MSHGVDPFEFSGGQPPRLELLDFQDEVLSSCHSCHRAPGIYSVQSYARDFEVRLLRPPQLADGGSDREFFAAIAWKKRQYEWGLLQGLLQRD
jgi:hypothetical protein